MSEPSYNSVANALTEVWKGQLASQLTFPKVLEVMKPSAEEQAERRQTLLRQQMLLEGFVERYKALADEYGVDICAGYDGEAWFQLGYASVDATRLS